MVIVLDTEIAVTVCKIVLKEVHIWSDVQVYMLSYPKNISAVKKGEAKKVQVAERPKDVISL